jgi:hypothetical protein
MGLVPLASGATALYKQPLRNALPERNEGLRTLPLLKAITSFNTLSLETTTHFLVFVYYTFKRQTKYCYATTLLKCISVNVVKQTTCTT